ncbi:MULTISPECIES: hypothetical protein [unclassified Aureimonas]|uniref:hypothetical protein n=1 Tax=unclassified Aureimonas TaxID=2615206 RepID=UPI00078583AB|nr:MULTISPECIES: hypothetical protein [unclassified Aureimonas]
MLAHQIAAAIEAIRPSQFHDLSLTLWRGHAAGLIEDTEAQRLAEALEARRKPPKLLHELPRPRQSLFPKRRPQLAKRHPERIGRRRRLAATGPLPATLAADWTTSALAVLRIVGDEVRDKGACERTLPEIAARAGVCRTTAQTTIRRAAQLGLVSIEERRREGAKNLPNVVRIISAEWMTWLRRGPRARDTAEDAGIGFKNTSPTETHLFSKSPIPKPSTPHKSSRETKERIDRPPKAR